MINRDAPAPYEGRAGARGSVSRGVFHGDGSLATDIPEDTR